MEILPSEYQSIDLSRYEKLFVRHAISSDEYGFLLLKVNPAMVKNDYVHVLILSQGVLFCKFFDGFDDPSQFAATMSAYASFVYPTTKNIIAQKLLSNKTLCEGGKLKFPASIIHFFPNLKKSTINTAALAPEVSAFMEESCLFAEDFSKLRTEFKEIMARYLPASIVQVADDRLTITNSNVNAIMQRIAPEYVTVRVAEIKDENTNRGADEELLVVDENDIAVKAFRLDREQVNIVNKITKGDQLILACAGSGKSVLLISKCFKAARMNPDKQFLITCYNDNLKSLYTWFIDRAGLREKNVTCMTFHSLCRNLLRKNGFHTAHADYDGWVSAAIDRLNNGGIKDRFYGIFIDEVQIFQSEWYRFCYNLLENKSSDDHLFVICGDKTQDLKKLQKHGKAPWQAGEGYPNYRGGNKNIRIERNYRNCIEINEYINRFVSNAKRYLYSIQPDFDIDPDLFLRGQAVSHGLGVEYKQLRNFSNAGEVDAIISSIMKIHDEHEIPYDEIAVIMYNGVYNSRLPGWRDYRYYLEYNLTRKLNELDIPFCKLYSADGEWQDHFGETGGVRLIKFRSVLGLDFRGAIICGMKPLGYYEGIKKPNWDTLRGNEEKYADAVDATHALIRNLYVACTRAKEVLHIIAPETPNDSDFIKLLSDSV